jgi:hypothetical protein
VPGRSRAQAGWLPIRLAPGFCGEGLVSGELADAGRQRASREQCWSAWPSLRSAEPRRPARRRRAVLTGLRSPPSAKPSVVFAALIGVRASGESFGKRRVAAAVVIATGVVLIEDAAAVRQAEELALDLVRRAHLNRVPVADLIDAVIAKVGNGSRIDGTWVREGWRGLG